LFAGPAGYNDAESFRKALAQNIFALYQAQMDELHKHAAALDRVGYDIVKQRLGITRQTFRNWRRKGVPAYHREIILLLGAVAGHDMTELRNENV